jgi:cytochrome c oxidase accessory protein FixG
VKESDLGVLDEIYDGEGTFRDELATVDKSGKRKWIYPKMPKGVFYQYRKYVSYVLLIILFGLPWIKVGGKPFVLLNILGRKFILFGVYFSPQDFYLFVIAMLIGIIFIALFTVIFGRLFCGWVCPQTIFMEMVYRRIEYAIEGDYKAQMRLNDAPWTTSKILKKILKQAIFFGIAILIANTFLAYIIGKDEVLKIASEPISANFNGFIAMIIFSLVFYGVFAFLREQVCTTICPYGRLQGVLLDDKSLAVYYDFERGEPRGKIKKNSPSEQKGDCIDCKLCIHVCPTGIDIRNGLQLECVNCTACMDVCDEVMTKVKRPTGLIRMDSLEGITSGVKKIFNSRVIAYSVVLVGLVVLEGFLMVQRSDVETLILRTPGTLFYKTDDGDIKNLYNYQLNNKTEMSSEVSLEVTNMEALIEYVGNPPQLSPNEMTEGALFITIDDEDVINRKTQLNIEVKVDGKTIDEASTTFFGPIK